MAQIITYNPQPYSYIQTIPITGTYTLPTGSIHFEVKKVTNKSRIILDHNWYGEIKYVSPNSYLSLYATTDEITEYYEPPKPTALLVKIVSNGIILENNLSSSLDIMITILL